MTLKSKNNMDNKQLINFAYDAMDMAYAPYSHYKVGAAVYTNGKVYLGCNIENASYGATICAERCAIAKAVSEGNLNLEKIAIVSSTHDFTAPCGICRQVMNEFMPEGVVVLTNDREIKEFLVSDLLPTGFSQTDMKGLSHGE